MSSFCPLVQLFSPLVPFPSRTPMTTYSLPPYFRLCTNWFYNYQTKIFVKHISWLDSGHFVHLCFICSSHVHFLYLVQPQSIPLDFLHQNCDVPYLCSCNTWIYSVHFNPGLAYLFYSNYKILDNKIIMYDCTLISQKLA